MSQQEMHRRARNQLHELRAKRNNFEQIVQSRALTDQEKKEFASVKSDLTEARDAYVELDLRMAKQDEANEARARLNLDDTITPSIYDTPGDSINEQERSILMDVAEGRATHAILNHKHKADLDQAESRALHTGSTGAGAETMTDKVVRDFYEVIDRSSGVWAAAGKIDTQLDESPFKLPLLTDHGAGDSELAEGGDITEDDLGTGDANFNAYRYTGIQVLSNSLLNSSVVDMQLWIAKALAQRLVKQWRDRLTIGTGTNMPQGIAVGAGAGITAAAVDAVTADELVDLVHEVSPENRDTRRSAWVMHDSTWQAIRKLKDNDDNYIVGSLANGAELTLSGYPVILDQGMPEMATGNRAIVFGAIKDAYLIRHCDIRIDISHAYRFQQDEVAWRAVQALDAKVIDATAIKALEMG